MSGKTVQPKSKGRASKGKTKKGIDNGLDRLYARVKPEVKEIIDEAAREDGRSTMNYVERLLTKHAESLKKKKGKN
jgi:uncharacterized protein (DUF1778 family)